MNALYLFSAFIITYATDTFLVNCLLVTSGIYMTIYDVRIKWKSFVSTEINKLILNSIKQ